MQKTIATCAALTLLFLMVVFPMTLKLLYVKAALFAMLGYITVLTWVASNHLGLHRRILVWTLFVSTTGVFFSFVGVINGAPGALKQLQVYGFWPLVYTAIIGVISDELILTRIHKTLIVATVTVGLYGLLILLMAMGEIREYDIIRWLSFGEEEAGGRRDGFFAMRYQGLNSLPFLIPYLLAFACAEDREWRASIPWRFLLWSGILLALCVAIISGRRGLQLVVLAAPLIVLWIGRHLQRPQRAEMRSELIRLLLACFVFALLVFVYLGNRFGVTFEGMIDSFKAGFEFAIADNESTYARREQWYALIQGWEDHPLLGSGHGATAAGSIRSYEMPWAYELYYVALLYQVGLLGLMAYGAAIAWIFVQGTRVIKNGGRLGSLMFASLVGLVGVLIASATNPYLARFDGWWVIFLPLAVINYWIVRARRMTGEASPLTTIVQQPRSALRT